MPIAKKITGILGFDEISEGGLPDARIVNITGEAGTGKTVFALQTLVNRARLLGESGLFISFEEEPERIIANAESFNWNIRALVPAKISYLDGRLPVDMEQSGEFDLNALLALATVLIREIDARTVVFDGIDMLLSLLPSEAIERREISRIDRWVSDNNLSCLFTSKTAAGTDRERSRQAYFHYLVDGVVELHAQLYGATHARSLRISKYRGSGFAANAFPAVFTDYGLEVAATRGSRFGYPRFEERLGTGVPSLDQLIEGGYRRGTVTLFSGAPGTSKTTFSCHFVHQACRVGETVVYVSLDQTDSQILGDARSMGIDLDSFVASQKLVMAPLRSNTRSPEEHFVLIRRLLDTHRPSCMVIDPISALNRAGSPFSGTICETLIDEVRGRGITLLCTSLLNGQFDDQELTVSGISTLADTWIHLTYSLRGGERNRALTIVKSRGTKHSRQMHELLVGTDGLELVEVYSAKGDVLMGTARAEQAAAERRGTLEERLEAQRRDFNLRREQSALRAQLKIIEEELVWKDEEMRIIETETRERSEYARRDASERLRLRRGGEEEA